MTHEWFLWVVVAVNALFFIEALLNIAYFRSATKAPRIRTGPFVSVIVPARNEERSVARCLESLLAQDYDDYEVIVVDDDSSDATPKIVGGEQRRALTSEARPEAIGFLSCGVQ